VAGVLALPTAPLGSALILRGSRILLLPQEAVTLPDSLQYLTFCFWGEGEELRNINVKMSAHRETTKSYHGLSSIPPRRKTKACVGRSLVCRKSMTCTGNRGRSIKDLAFESAKDQCHAVYCESFAIVRSKLKQSID
jgi:hypothetical protein